MRLRGAISPCAARPSPASFADNHCSAPSSGTEDGAEALRRRVFYRTAKAVAPRPDVELMVATAPT
jgi:hypothetical protein